MNPAITNSNSSAETINPEQEQELAYCDTKKKDQTPLKKREIKEASKLEEKEEKVERLSQGV